MGGMDGLIDWNGLVVYVCIYARGSVSLKQLPAGRATCRLG